MTLRVLHLRSSSGWAGPERHLLELGRGLVAEGVSATLAVFDAGRGRRSGEHPLVAAARPACLEAFALPSSRIAPGRDVAAVARHLRAGGFDLVHSHDYRANWIGRRAALRAGIPALATVHLHTRSTLRLRLYHRLDRRELARFDGVLAVAAALLGDLPARLRNGARPRVVHNGVDAPRLRRRAAVEAEEARRAFADTGPGPRLLAVGRLAFQKGFDLLLAALAALPADGAAPRLVLAGDGPERASLVREIARRGLAERVALLGERGDIAGLMSAADLVVLPSRREGLPYVALEALALERPVVATAAGGIPELIVDRKTGWLAEPGSVRSLADALGRALAEPERGAELARRGRERVERAFDAAAMAAANAQAYREIAA